MATVNPRPTTLNEHPLLHPPSLCYADSPRRHQHHLDVDVEAPNHRHRRQRRPCRRRLDLNDPHLPLLHMRPSLSCILAAACSTSTINYEVSRHSTKRRATHRSSSPNLRSRSGCHSMLMYLHPLSPSSSQPRASSTPSLSPPPWSTNHHSPTLTRSRSANLIDLELHLSRSTLIVSTALTLSSHRRRHSLLVLRRRATGWISSHRRSHNLAFYFMHERGQERERVREKSSWVRIRSNPTR